MKVNVLRLEAPMMSFGGPIVSEEGLIQPYPALSMMTGLLANALGYRRREADRHERLQESLSYAVREDQPGEKISDYQTVDLGAGYMQAQTKRDSVAWTTWGELDQREGGSASKGTAERNREYWADASYTVSLVVEEMPAERVRNALQRPARPLFIGRKSCLPSRPLHCMIVEASGVEEALRLRETFPDETIEDFDRVRAWWASPEGDPVTDARDWTNQIHVGRRQIAQEYISVPTLSTDG
ncbi:MAG: type I-E CRISPR-associated protein Cas5/CasD [Salinibacter sp.]